MYIKIEMNYVIQHFEIDIYPYCDPPSAEKKITTLCLLLLVLMFKHCEITSLVLFYAMACGYVAKFMYLHKKLTLLYKPEALVDLLTNTCW